MQGNVTLVAGETYRQTASSVIAAGLAGPLAGGDVNILAKNVLINEAYNTEQTVGVTRGSSTVLGGTASVGGISINTLRNARDTVNAIDDTDDSRMKALGAVSLAMSGAQAYDTASAIAGGGNVGFKVGASVSRNKNESTTFSNSSVAVGSSIVGANNVNIIATGGGQDSNIHAIGSTIAAGNTVNLAADNAVTLEASRNVRESAGVNSSSGASVGVSYAMGNQNGFTIELAASTGKGNANQNDVTYNNTHVSGGNAVNIVAGGDLTLKGAVVEANRVAADVGGNLNIESLQDVSVGQTHRSSSGLNASLCIPPICYGISTVGGNSEKANTNGVYASVNEQSGIKAGDGGFDVNVKGNTDLKGGIVSSTQSAIDAGLNSLRTGTLTTSDLANLSTGSASSSGVSIDSETLSQGKYGAAKTVIGAALNSGSAKASSAGATRAAVSGGSIVIANESGQVALTGKTAGEAVAALNRDTATANVPAIRQNLEELQKEAQAQQIIKNGAFQQATAYSDEAYRRMFIEAAPMALIDRNADGSIKYDDNGKPMMHILTPEEKKNLQAGPDGKIHVADNGIFNDLDAAAKYAAQHSTGEGGPQYFVYFPEANNAVSELMIAGYQSFMEGSTLGLTNATKETVELMNQYGQDGLHLDGHSRGSMTIGNALQYMEDQSSSGGLLAGTTINFFGPAFNVQKADQLLGSLQDRTSVTDPQKLIDMTLQYQNHMADPVGGLIGGNAPTGGTIPDGSGILTEAIRAATGQPITSHNCYGQSSQQGCGGFWGGGFPSFQRAPH